MKMLGVCLVVAACGSPPPPAPVTHHAPTVPRSSAVIIELTRTACRGPCPSYQLAITTTGRVDYTGRSWVQHEGKATWSIPTARVDELVTAFEAAGVTAFPSNLEGTATDVPFLHLRFRDKQILYSEGGVLRGSPEEAQRNAIERLTSAVDRAVDIERYIGTVAWRSEKFAAMRLERARAICEKRPQAARPDCYEDHAVTPP